MARVPVPVTKSSAASDVLPNLASFTRHLRGESKSPATITTYVKAVLQLADFLVASGMPTIVASIRREHIEAFLIDLQKRACRPATSSQRFRALQQSFKWLRDEGEVRESPMANMRPPHVPEEPPPVLREPDLGARPLTTCSTPAASSSAAKALAAGNTLARAPLPDEGQTAHQSRDGTRAERRGVKSCWRTWRSARAHRFRSPRSR
jgi:hypothetical protein